MNDKIGPVTISKIKAELDMLLEDHMSRMNQAYQQQEDELGVSIALKFAPYKDGIKVAYQISYTTGKVKDGDTIIVDEKQLGLFEAA